MFSIRGLIGPARRMLAGRIDQLCATLETLGGRVRDAVTAAIGETLSGIIRDAVMRVLGEVANRLPGSEAMSTTPARASPNTRYFDRQDQNYWGDAIYEDDPFQDDVVVEPSAPRVTERLPTALATGLRAASWWLGRCTGPARTWSTLAAGLIATTAAFFGGPVVVAALGLAESASHISALAEAVEQAGTYPRSH